MRASHLVSLACVLALSACAATKTGPGASGPDDTRPFIWTVEKARVDTRAALAQATSPEEAASVDLSYIGPDLLEAYAQSEVVPRASQLPMVESWLYYGHHHVALRDYCGFLVHYYTNDNPGGVPDRESDLCWGSHRWMNPWITKYQPGHECRINNAPGYGTPTIRGQ